ncbi:MAG: peptidase M4 [Proteobacteria bacterium]|nr:peptidase M4 [Pseudomonadota bacterium]
MKLSKSFLAASAIALGLGAAVTAHAFDGQQYTKDAKVTLEQARAIALKAIPGATITDQELEHETGGSGLRYSFDVKVGQAEHEIGVDAKTGAVLENSVEGQNKD